MRIRTSRFASISPILLILIGLFAMSIISPEAFTFSNLGVYIRMLVPFGIMAIGLYPVMISGYIDVSQYAIAQFTGALAAMASNNSEVVFPILAAGVLVGMGLGFVNGTVVTRFKVHPILTTYCMSLIIKGIMFVVTQGRMVTLSNTKLLSVGRGSLLGIPYPIILLFIVFGIIMYVLHYSMFGRRLIATGLNDRASYYSGIATNRIKTLAFAVSGASAALAGITMAAIDASIATGLDISVNLSAIIILVLGGTDFRNVGRPYGIFFGMLLFGMLERGFLLLGVADYYHMFFRGCVLLLVIISNSFFRERSS